MANNSNKRTSGRIKTRLRQCCLAGSDVSAPQKPRTHKKSRKLKFVTPTIPRWVPNAIPLKQLPKISGEPAPPVSLETLRERRAYVMEQFVARKESVITENCNRTDTRRSCQQTSLRADSASHAKGTSMETRSKRQNNQNLCPDDANNNAVTNTLDSAVNYECVQDLLKRIAAIPIKNRPVPNSDDPRELGFELKIRLATRTPVLDISVDMKGRNCVTAKRVNKRHIPVYEFNEEDDPMLHCLMKITTKYCNRRR